MDIILVRVYTRPSKKIKHLAIRGFAVELSNWKQCLQHLREMIPQKQFSQWISPLQAQQSLDGVVVFAPNK